MIIINFLWRGKFCISSTTIEDYRQNGIKGRTSSFCWKVNKSLSFNERFSKSYVAYL